MLPIDNWAISASDYEWVRTNFIADRANIAHAAGKPIIMEESGMKTGYLPSRSSFLANIYEWANENDYAGTLVWQVYAWYVSAHVCLCPALPILALP